MSGLFGRGGGVDPIPTEPAPLDFGGDKSEIRDKIGKTGPTRPTGGAPSYGNTGGFGGSLGGGYRPGGGSGGYQSGGGVQKPRVDSPKEFSDMQTTDGLTDEEIRQLRLKAYQLSNIEKEYDIIHKNDFNKIVKFVMIGFSVLVAFVFMIIVAIIGYTSIKTGTITETGIINSILQFIADVMRIGLS